MIHDDLAAKHKDELRGLLVQKGASFSPSETKIQLLQRLRELNLAAQPGSDDRGQRTGIGKHNFSATETRLCSQEVVEKALKRFSDTGLAVHFSEDGQQWHMRRAMPPRRDVHTGLPVDVVREDSGSMFQPLATIKRCAEMLMARSG